MILLVQTNYPSIHYPRVNRTQSQTVHTFITQEENHAKDKSNVQGSFHKKRNEKQCLKITSKIKRKIKESKRKRYNKREEKKRNGDIGKENIGEKHAKDQKASETHKIPNRQTSDRQTTKSPIPNTLRVNKHPSSNHSTSPKLILFYATKENKEKIRKVSPGFQAQQNKRSNKKPPRSIPYP